MTNQRQLPPLKGQSEMCANLSLPSLSAPFTTHTICVFFFFFEPPRASLCLKLRVMALFTSREDHAERKGLAVARAFLVKTLIGGALCSFVAVSGWQPFSAFDTCCTHQTGKKKKNNLISAYTFSTAEWSLLALRGGHKYLWDIFRPLHHSEYHQTGASYMKQAVLKGERRGN